MEEFSDDDNDINGSKKGKKPAKFQVSWLSKSSWLRKEKGGMFCQICRDNNGKNTLAIGTQNYRTSTLKC